MLVLSRKKGESVFIIVDGEIVCEVTTVETRSDRVRIGFSAADSVTIHREEVHHAIKRDERLKALKESSSS